MNVRARYVPSRCRRCSLFTLVRIHFDITLKNNVGNGSHTRTERERELEEERKRQEFYADVCIYCMISLRINQIETFAREKSLNFHIFRIKKRTIRQQHK